MNNYYLSQNSAASSCDFQGSASLKTAEKPSSDCKALMAQAKSDGTGTITSTITTGSSTGSSPSSTGKVLSTSTAANGQVTTVPVSGDGSSNGSNKSSGALSTGAKAGIAIGVVLLVIIAAFLAFFLWRRRQKKNLSEKGPPESGQGGLEVGDAPPQFTTLRAAELDANGRGGYHEAKPDDPLNTDHVHEFPAMAGGVGVEELSGEPTRRELDGTVSGATHAELPADAQRSERAELGPSGSHQLRKPVGGFAPNAISPNLLPQSQQHKPLASSSWVNSPWSDPGFEQESSSHSQPEHPPPPQNAPPQIPIPIAHLHEEPGSPTEQDELLRMEEEERRIDEAIAESERLQALRREKDELQKKMLEARAKKSGGGGPSGS
jgi:hypothetical protein